MPEVSLILSGISFATAMVALGAAMYLLGRNNERSKHEDIMAMQKRAYEEGRRTPFPGLIDGVHYEDGKPVAPPSTARGRRAAAEEAPEPNRFVARKTPFREEVSRLGPRSVPFVKGGEK